MMNFTIFLLAIVTTCHAFTITTTSNPPATIRTTRKITFATPFSSTTQQFTLRQRRNDWVLQNKKGPNEEANDGSAGVRQLLGVKGASAETDIWKIRLQLTKVRKGMLHTISYLHQNTHIYR
jgi:chlorophyll/bacteriochlorophyll a synthase